MKIRKNHESHSLRNRIKTIWPSNLGLFVAVILTSCSAAQASEQQLHGQVPEVAAHLTATGRLAATNELRLAICLPLRHQEALSNLLQQICDPASPAYRHYLTPAEFTERFGPTASDYQAVIAFAKAHGLAVSGTHSNRTLLDVSGTVGDIEKAFHVTLRIYQHPTEARSFYAPEAEPSVDLAVPVSYIAGLNNYDLPHPLFKRRPADQQKPFAADTGSGPGGNFMGSDFRDAYAPGVTLTGAGQTVALFELDGYDASDITYYEATNGLLDVTVTNVLLGGFAGFPTNGGEVEVCLDIEMAISMAPGLSQVMVYEAPLTSVGAYDILNQIATDNQAKQISSSWVIDRVVTTPVPNSIYQEYVAQGQSFFQASGDDDAYGAGIYQTAGNPYTITVGGTTLTTTGSGGSYVSETVWQWGGGTGSGGGTNTTYPFPSYQVGLNMTTNGGSTAYRNVPDVALTADDVYVRAGGVDNVGVGGTSCAAPLWAGFTALVNQQAVAAGKSTVGFINPAVYALAQTPGYTNCFHDIVTGNNTNAVSPTLYYACPGYDLCTGWGTPAGQSLINALAVPDPLTVMPYTGFAAVGGPHGPFSTTIQTFALTNSGTNILSWTLSNTSLWLNASSSGGTLTPGGPAATVTMGLNSVASNLPPAIYTAMVWFTNLSDGIGEGRMFSLNVLGAPQIVSQPASLLVRFGGTASFSVNATGAPPMSYSWRCNGAPIAGATQPTYTTNNVQVVDTGAQFSCQITNAYGSTNTLAAILTVSPSLIVNGGFETGDFTGWGGDQDGAAVTTDSAYVHSGNYGAELGTVGTLGYLSQALPTVPGSNYLVSLWLDNPDGGTPSEFQVMWNATVLYDAVDLPLLGWTNLQFLVTASTTNDTLQLGFRQDPSFLGLDDVSVDPTNIPPSAPVIVTQPANQSVTVGSSATFCVTAFGTLPLSYYWSRNGSFLSGATNSCYTINNVQLTDSGSQFSCVVSNIYGTATSSNAVLTVSPATTGLITFDDWPGSTGVALTNGYHGLNWSNFYVLDAFDYGQSSGYQVGMISASNVAYNAFGTPAAISASTPFSFLSAYLTAAWNQGLVLEALGYNGSTLLYSNTYTLSATNPTLINFNFLGITEIYFAASGGYPWPPYGTNSATHFAMDNVTIGSGTPTVVTTTNAWNGANYIWSFGEPNTATYGQTFVVPSQSPSLTSFTLYISNITASASFQFYVMAWNGTNATGSILYQSPATSTAGQTGWQAYAFNPGGLSLTPGGSYVAFISDSTLQDGGSSSAAVGSPATYAYTNGYFAFNNNGTNFSLLTNSAWTAWTNNDLAFVAVFGGGVAGSAPSITAQPASVTVPVGGNASFAVDASGSASLSYFWMCNGGWIPGATNATYVTNNVQLTASGSQFSCLVSNAYGVATSSNATLTVVALPPSITQQPTNQTVRIGATATFTVSASGTAPLSYFWQLNGSSIAGANASSYSFTNVQVSESGSEFTCVITNIAGAVTSSVAILKVDTTVANDQCSGAIIITDLTYTNAQYTTNATSTGDPVPDCVYDFGNGVWYVYTPVVNGQLEVDTFGSDFDTGLALYTGSCGALTEVACNDDTDGLQSQCILPVVAGTTYYILAGGYSGYTGHLLIHLALTVPVTLDHFGWSPIAPLQAVNAPFSAAVTALSPLNVTVTNFNGPVNLSASTGGGGGLTTNMILGNLVYADSGDYGTFSLGYSFTPNTNLTVTGVRSYSGTKVSIWTDAGTLLATQAVASVPGTWVATPLATPLPLVASNTYRVVFYSAGSNYYWRTDGSSTFAYGTINQSYEAVGDTFPTTTDTARWWLVDLQYTVGSSGALTITPTVSGPFTNGVWTGNIAVLQVATNVVLSASDGSGHVGSSNPFQVAPLLITQVSLLSHGSIQITMGSLIGDVFRVQGSTNLLSWQTVATVTNVTGSIQFTDPGAATNYSHRFYRLVMP